MRGSSQSISGALLAHHVRARPGGLGLTILTGLGATLVGLWLGLDLRGSPDRIGETLFALLLAASAPLPLVALGSLYHDRLHVAVLPWPVSAAQHLALGLRLFAASQWPWPVLLSAACLSATLSLGAQAMLAALVFCLAGFVGSALFALGAAGFCALLSDAEGPTAERVRAGLAGPFSTQRHAPFFYLPALAFGLSALAAGLTQEAVLLPLLGAAVPGLYHAPRVVWLAAPVLAGLVALAAGSWSYTRHALRVIPRVHEEARMIYGGKPAPADPPYGLLLARLLPRSAAPYYCKELREQSRAQRGLWAVVAMALLFAALYALGTGAPARTAPVLALVLVVWAATLPTRRTKRELAAGLVLTLPHSARASWLGRWLALLFVALHLGAVATAALWARGQTHEALVLASTCVAGSTAAISATQPGTRVGTTLAPAATLALGLAALAWFPLGLIGPLALCTFASWRGLRR